ncbi:unnamed protein product [Paramecium pentaurelia]|uniref:Secreted protein n=1 Tax=Paramecium pentaurelia TaxID=43138 RepID=A0A8S1VXI4_9CILI|nr:unnamed protein product [Paramecium pentaurelia]
MGQYSLSQLSFLFLSAAVCLLKGGNPSPAALHGRRACPLSQGPPDSKPRLRVWIVKLNIVHNVYLFFWKSSNIIKIHYFNWIEETLQIEFILILQFVLKT